MTKKTKVAIITATIAALAVGVFLWLSPNIGGRGPQIQTQIPITILPLGDGFPLDMVEKDPTQAYKLLLDSGAFSYYTDPVRFAKVPLSGMNVKVTGNRGAPAWSSHPDTELKVWKLTTAAGGVKMVSTVDASESYVSKELIAVTLSGGQWLRLSPEYTWEIDPEYFIAPPGIIQDLYLTDSAKVETYTFASVTVDATGHIKETAITGKAHDELSETFKRTYKTSVIANWQVDVPSDIVRRIELKVDLVAGAQVDFNLMAGNSMTFQLTGVPDRDHVSFKMGSNSFTGVPIGALRQLGTLPVVVHLVKEQQNVLTVRVHAIDAAKAQQNAISVVFRVNASDVGSPAVVPPVETRSVQSLPNESTEFTTLRDISVWDLRGWRPVPPDKASARWSPANYYNYLHVRKDKAASVYRAHYSTEGSAIDIRCITQEAKVFEATADPLHPDRKYYAIEVNASDEGVGKDFLVVIEATYWNGFQRDTNWWVATYADDDAAADIELATFVLFPEWKPFSEVHYAFNPGTGESPLRADNIPFTGSRVRAV